MIKCDLGKVLHISGHPAQVAAELEDLARNVRKAFCAILGDEEGTRLFEECIESAKMSIEERDQYVSKCMKEAEILDPEGAKISKEFADAFLEKLSGGGLR